VERGNVDTRKGGSCIYKLMGVLFRNFERNPENYKLKPLPEMLQRFQIFLLFNLSHLDDKCEKK